MAESSEVFGLKDSAGVELSKGDRVQDVFFGKGKVVGKAPLDNGSGENVLVDWDEKGGEGRMGTTPEEPSGSGPPTPEPNGAC